MKMDNQSKLKDKWGNVIHRDVSYEKYIEALEERDRLQRKIDEITVCRDHWKKSYRVVRKRELELIEKIDLMESERMD